MTMAAEMTPTSRIHLFHVKRGDEFQVWELVDVVPPSEARELGPNSSPDQGLEGASKSTPSGCREPSRQQCLPALVLEVSGNGEVIAWPGPETVP